MTWVDAFTGAFIIFMGVYFCVLFHYLSGSKIGDIDERTNI